MKWIIIGMAALLLLYIIIISPLIEDWQHKKEIKQWEKEDRIKGIKRHYL